jgi:predicted alpha/beta hydrolase family esterase
MRILENYFVKIIPHTIFLVSEFNQNKVDLSIEEMGKNLAREVQMFSKSFKNFSKISFVGHSLGGVVIRAALPHLKSLRPYMCSYVSLSVPHLGCKKSSNVLINLGLKFLTTVKKDLVIKQLQMEDHPDIRKTAIYRLSQEDCLHWFQNILLVSSPQDDYVPYFSSRIERRLNQTSELADIISEMVSNIWGQVNNEKITRFDVIVETPKK